MGQLNYTLLCLIKNLHRLVRLFKAKLGDFMKIFWSRAVGRNEHDHSTIFLGTENRAGWPVRSLLVEQCSLGLWGEECAAKQNRLRALLATRNAEQSGANH